MAVYSKGIIDKASELLLDEGVTRRWPTSQLLGWLNAGQRQIVILKPDAHVTVAAYQLVAGSKQSLPDGTNSFQDPNGATLPAGLLLMGVSRNMGADGLTAGRAITLVNREILDALDPEWHVIGTNSSAVVQHIAYKAKVPKVFWVYPSQPATGQGYVELEFSSSPTPCAGYGEETADAIDLDDIYEDALIDYLMYRAYSKDANSDSSGQRALLYLQSFLTALGVRGQTELGHDPNEVIQAQPPSYK